jgi:hypothetical protein
MEWRYKKTDAVGPMEKTFGKRRRRVGLRVGLEENGNLVDVADVLRTEILGSVSMVNQEEACILLGLSDTDPSATLTRHKGDRQILRFENEGRIAYPLFQFDEAGRRVYPALIELMEMRSDDWGSEMSLLHWLTRPNCSLGGERPCDRLANDANAIVASFQAERSEPFHG